MSSVVDGRVNMHDMQSLANTSPASRAGALFAILRDRAERGVGGEVKFDWEEAPIWLRSNVKVRHALGGTGPQAAWVLSKLGGRALIALEDRHALMLDQIPPGILLAQDGQLVEVDKVRPSTRDVPETFIFEYTAGLIVGDVIPQRSSRIIVRFIDRGIQNDSDFDLLSVRLAGKAAAGLLSGLNDVSSEDLPDASDRLFKLAKAWRENGLKTVHYELAGYASLEALRYVLWSCRGSITSIGMSQSELLTIESSAQMPMEAMISLGERLGLDRVCVHADTWAASVTTGDPKQELQAIMAGCAIASARSAAGAPVHEVKIDLRAEFQDLPFSGYEQRGKWSFVACPAPYLERPATTLGLGDSFTAGCLLILGRKFAQ